MTEGEERSNGRMEPVPGGRMPGELVFCLVLLMGSLVLLHQAWTIAGFRSFSSAGVFPMLAAATMVASGAVIALGTLRARPEHRGLTAGGFLREVAGPKILFVGAAITAYLFLLQPLGFVVSSILFLAVTICGLHRRDYPWMVLISIVLVAVVYLLFRKVFLVVLPSGVFL